MARYIDVDKIAFEEIPASENHEIILVNKCLFFGRRNGKQMEQFKDAFKQIIDNAPTEDVVKVVRCKDCKHFGKDLGYGKHDCKKYEMPYCLENDYCSYGERKE